MLIALIVPMFAVNYPMIIRLLACLLSTYLPLFLLSRITSTMYTNDGPRNYPPMTV